MLKGVEKVLAYAFDCITGGVVCCQKHKWACERFLKDYDLAVSGKGPYQYDWAQVDKVLRWATLFKHTKGVLAGQYIELPISKVFVTANLYGFYHKETGYRRFKKLYLQEARKNMKSQYLAIISSYELMVFLNGGMAEVYCAATKRDQARIVYDEIHRIMQQCKDLRGKWKETYNTITHIKSGSTLKTLSKEDKKFGDGLNPQCACIDEYHAHQTSEVLDVIESGMGARPEPLLAIITTAGFDLAYPCYTIEYKLVSQILDPDCNLQIDHVFADIHELEVNNTSEDIEVEGRKIAPGDLLDNPFDENNWPKANPIICSYFEGVQYLRDKAKEAQAASEKKRNFYTKHLNVWVNQRGAGYMPLQRWVACKGKIPSLRKLLCYAGLDLSSKIDLAAAGLVFPLELGEIVKYIILCKAFMPENTFAKHEKTDKTAFYTLWKDNGHLIVTPGASVSYRAVVNWVLDTVKQLGAHLEEFCVDPWGAVHITSDLIHEGYTVVDIIQGPRTLSEPTKAFREAVYDKRVIHNGDPVLSWAIGNAVVVSTDRNQNILLSKKDSPQRIDPIAAVLNGFTRAYASGIDGSCYNANQDLIRSL